MIFGILQIIFLLYAFYENYVNAILYSILLVAILEVFSNIPIIKKEKRLCENCTIHLVKQLLMHFLMLSHIENIYLRQMMIFGCIFACTRQIALMKGQKNLENLVKSNYFIAIYTQSFGCFRLINTSALFFMVFFFIQLEAHSLELIDLIKLYSLGLSNLTFLGYFSFTLSNIIETKLYWSQQQKNKIE